MAQRIIEVTLFVDVDIENNEVAIESYDVAGGTSADLELAARAMVQAAPILTRDAAKEIGVKLVATSNYIYIHTLCALCGTYIHDPSAGVVTLDAHRGAIVCDDCADHIDPGVRELAKVIDFYVNAFFAAPDTPPVVETLLEGVTTAEFTPETLTRQLNQAIEDAGCIVPTPENPHPFREATSELASDAIDDIPF